MAGDVSATRRVVPGNESDGFEQWLVAKSFTMLAPMSLVGLVVVSSMLLLVDPALYAAGIWGGHEQHAFLVAWHISALVLFALFLAATRLGNSHGRRSGILTAFFVASAILFSWFAFISWMLSGDLSTYAIFLLTMACVFCVPGQLRKMLTIGSTLAVIFFILLLDQRGIFHTSGAAINLVALAIVAMLLDRFLTRLNLALFREKRQVEFERARADRVLYNALPASIADELKANNIVKAEKFPRMAVLFADIAGFTEFSASRTPDELVQILNEIFSGFDRLVDHYGVEKIKTIGDAYMVVGKDGGAAVARLATDMLTQMQAYNQNHGYNLQLRCGLHIGPTVAGVIGLKRFLYDVWGDAVNLASRMESSGLPGRIHVSEEVFRQLQHEFLFESRGQTEIRGKGRMATHFLLGPRAAHADAAPAPRPLGRVRPVTPSDATILGGGSSETPSGQPVCGGCAE